MANDIYCIKDQCFYVKEHTGVEIKALYATRRGDLYRCPICGTVVLGDFGEWVKTIDR